VNIFQWLASNQYQAKGTILGGRKMRAFVAVLAVACAALLVSADANFGQDKKKEVTLKGKITCNKCELMKSDKCETVIVVKDKKTKKDVVYFFDKAGHGKFHDDICTAAKNGTVTGTVKTANKKKTITIKKVTYD
jgi:Family of unknown function (DUF6370)